MKISKGQKYRKLKKGKNEAIKKVCNDNPKETNDSTFLAGKTFMKGKNRTFRIHETRKVKGSLLPVHLTRDVIICEDEYLK